MVEKLDTSYRRIIEINEKNSVSSSEKEYLTLFNFSPIPMWVFDTETHSFLMVNQAACDTYGYSKEEFLSMTLRDIRPKEDLIVFEEIVSKPRPVHHVFPGIINHQKKNGDILRVKPKTDLVTYKGKYARLAFIIDVTEEIENHQKLIDTNARLKSASEIASLGYWTHDLEAKKIEWSDDVYRIFEIEKDTYDLKSIIEMYHEDDFKLIDQKAIHDNNERTVIENEHRIMTGKGRLKWILERKDIIKDSEGVPIKIEGVFIDISNRKFYEQEILESNERFKLIAKATVEAIVDRDLKNNKVIWGEGFNSVFGYELNTFTTEMWIENVHPNERKTVLEDISYAIENPSKQNFICEFDFKKANGEYAFVQMKGILVRDKSGVATRALAAMIDLTETKERIRKIELQNDTLKEIAWTQSHIVRAPLANLMGFVGLLKEKEKVDLSEEELIEYICNSAEKLDSVIHEIVSKSNEPI